MIAQGNELSKTYRQGEATVHALKSASFEISQGETVAFTGPSGSGKTTLLSLIAGLERPSGGRLNLLGQNLLSLSESDLTQFRGENIGIVFQEYYLMPHLTALENVMLPLEILKKENSKFLAEKALDEVGLSQRIHHKPNELSGGECQRVALARAFVTEPKLLLADEPSGSLDTETGVKVMSLLFKLAQEKNMTLVLITHDLQLANKCDRVIKMSGGQLL